MPLNTDWLMAEYLAERVASFLEYPGSIGHETFKEFVKDYHPLVVETRRGALRIGRLRPTPQRESTATQLQGEGAPHRRSETSYRMLRR